MVRNENVEKAVDLLVGLVDRLSNGEALGKPAAEQLSRLFNSHVAGHGGSVKLACAFLTAYSVVDPQWDHKSVPTGIRGAYGDKKLAMALNFRYVTFHNNITAFGENLGWKGAVRQFDLSQDGRFSTYLAALRKLPNGDKATLLNHVAWQLHASRVMPQALPPLPGTYLSYARSLSLCEHLLDVPSEGHVQQFLVAAFLEVHRRRFGNRIVTHHPHASDKFDHTKGDIEEFRDYELVGAYEVTVRGDWKNRLTDFGKKIREANLVKYIIFASNVRNDIELSPAARLVEYVEKLPFDLAVVDIRDFFCVFCAELNREEIAVAFNRAYQLLADPRLSGREDILTKYRAATSEWLEG
jgi:hypothetical protein